MSPLAARRLLLVVALVTLPVPYYMAAVEFAPWLRLAFLAGLLSSVFAVEGGRVAGLFAGLGVTQALLYGALLYAGTRFVASLLGRIGAPTLRSVLVVGIAVLLCGVSLTDLYDTPLSSTRLRSSVWQLFD